MTDERFRTYLLGLVVGGGAILTGLMAGWVGIYVSGAAGSRHEISLPLIIITGVVFLLIVLGLLTFSLAALGLTNKDEALGLPSGSVRAVIALMLLVIFAIVAIYVFSVVFEADNAAGIDLAKQLIVLIGTLVTAVASFYFGSSSIAAVTKPPTSVGGPNAVSVSPGNLTPGGSAQPLTVTGTNLGNVANVKLTFDTQVPIVADANSVKAGPTSVSCTVTVRPDAPFGPWNVVASDNANNDSTVPNSVTIGTKPAAAAAEPAAGQSPIPEILGVSGTLTADGQEHTVNVLGRNLAGVDAVEKVKFKPDSGITVSAVTPNSSGNQLTFTVTIANATPPDRDLSVVNKAGESEPVGVKLEPA